MRAQRGVSAGNSVFCSLPDLDKRIDDSRATEPCASVFVGDETFDKCDETTCNDGDGVYGLECSVLHAGHVGLV